MTVRWLAIPAMALLVGGAAACGSSHNPAPAATHIPTNSATGYGWSVGDPPATHAAAPATHAAPASPAMTVGQQQAVDSARSYLNDGQGFSEQGLLNQLTSSSGEGYTKADAEFAISYLHPNWDQQAVVSAKNYLSDGEGFSRASLYQQLTSSAGEGFTPPGRLRPVQGRLVAPSTRHRPLARGGGRGGRLEALGVPCG